MPICETEGIVIHTQDWRETSRIVTFYTRDFGKAKLIAKGAKRLKTRFGSTLELFSHIHLIYYEKEQRELQVLGQASLIDSYRLLREDLEKITISSYIVWLVNEMVEAGEENRAVFELLRRTLALIRQAVDNELATHFYEINLLRYLGYQPCLDVCVHCRRKIKRGNVLFNPQKGGIVCLQCASGGGMQLTISRGTQSALLHLQRVPPQNLFRFKLTPNLRTELKTVLTAYLNHLLGKSLLSPINFT